MRPPSIMERLRLPDPVPRRGFISAVLAGAVACLPLWRPRHANAASPKTAAPQSIAATLGAFLDVILPRDALSGSASDLGVPGAMLAESKEKARDLLFIEQGCQWLDRAAAGNFAAVAPPQRHEIVTRISSLDWDEFPRRFYEVLRARAVDLYYSRPAAWAGIAISRPPQPHGYPDHSK